MAKTKVSIIAAIGENLALGKDNKLLWSIPKDLNRFREITLGHPVIMGRNTFESIGRPLPKRVNIVVTKDNSYKAEGCVITHSIEDAIKEAKKFDQQEVFVIGGGQIYKQALPLVDRLYLTVVKGTFEADTFFPDYSEFKTVIYKEEGEDQGYKYTFLDLQR